MRVHIKGKDINVSQRTFIAYCMGLLNEKISPFNSYQEEYLEQKLDLSLFSMRWCREMGIKQEKVAPILNQGKYSLLLREVKTPLYMHCVLHYMWASGFIPYHLDGMSPLWERDLWLFNAVREVIQYGRDESIVGGYLPLYYEMASFLPSVIDSDDLNTIVRGHTTDIKRTISHIEADGFLVRKEYEWHWVDQTIRERIALYPSIKLSEDTLTKACQQAYQQRLSTGQPY